MDWKWLRIKWIANGFESNGLDQIGLANDSLKCHAEAGLAPEQE